MCAFGNSIGRESAHNDLKIFVGFVSLADVWWIEQILKYSDMSPLQLTLTLSGLTFVFVCASNVTYRSRKAKILPLMI